MSTPGLLKTLVLQGFPAQNGVDVPCPKSVTGGVVVPPPHPLPLTGPLSQPLLIMSIPRSRTASRVRGSISCGNLHPRPSGPPLTPLHSWVRGNQERLRQRVPPEGRGRPRRAWAAGSGGGLRRRQGTRPTVETPSPGGPQALRLAQAATLSLHSTEGYRPG